MADNETKARPALTNNLSEGTKQRMKERCLEFFDKALNSPELTLAELAKLLGVTPGAVSNRYNSVQNAEGIAAAVLSGRKKKTIEDKVLDIVKGFPPEKRADFMRSIGVE